MEHLMIWGQFLVAAIIIIFCGIKLTKYADILSDRLKLGHAFVGAILIGWSTSLPELVISIGTSAYAKAPDITMGNVLGSNLFNIFIIVFLDLYYLRGPILRNATSKNLMLSVVLSLIMVALAGTALFTHIPAIQVGPVTIGYSAAIIFSVYMLSMLMLYLVEKFGKVEEEAHRKIVKKAIVVKDQEKEKFMDVSLKLVLGKCLIVVVLVVATGLWLSKMSETIQKVYDLQEGFVGAVFLAVVSSLPEFITSMIAVRMGFHNMAIGALFGSNIFNIAIFSICDIFYIEKDIFTIVQESRLNHVPAAIGVILMTLVVMFALRGNDKEGEERKSHFIGFSSILLAVLYAAAIYFTYKPDTLLPVWSFLGLL